MNETTQSVSGFCLHGNNNKVPIQYVTQTESFRTDTLQSMRQSLFNLFTVPDCRCELRCVIRPQVANSLLLSVF